MPRNYPATETPFAENLRAAIDASDLSISEVARRSGISRSLLGCYLKGTPPPLPTAVAIARALGKSLDKLAGLK